ncbi:MAG: hypothetical protein KF802_15185 [Bdellovibrionaceae bacterium]|nr:hypothetical protein [Pseudobdellovibrionaceae bacterium]
MISSKSLVFALTVSLLTVAGCSTESRKGRDFVPGQSTDFDKESGTTFRVKSFRIDSSSVAEFNAYNVPKKKQFNFSACLQDSNGGAFTTGVRVRVLDEQGNEAQCRTPDLKLGACIADFDGCVKWSETHEYAHMSANEVYYQFKRTVRAGKPYKGGVNINLVLNPWDNTWATSRDNTLPANIPVVDAQGSMSIKGGSLKAQSKAEDLRFGLDSVSFAFEKIDYPNFEITRLLGLTVAHQYRVSFKPTIIRKSYNGVDRVDSLAKGQFKLYFALFREKADPTKDAAAQFDVKNLISTSDFVATDEQSPGNYLSQVTFKIENIADLTSRTVALVTLKPLNDGSIAEKSFWAYVKPGRLSGLSLYPAAASAREFHEKSAQRQSVTQNTKALDLLKEEGFQNMSLSPVTIHGGFGAWGGRYNVNEAVQTALKQPVLQDRWNRLAAAMCAKALTDKQAVMECQRSPSQWLTLKRLDLVENILSQPQKMNGRALTESFRMGISYGYSAATSTSVGGKFSAGLSAGIAAPLDNLPFGKALNLKASVGADVFYSSGYTVGWGEKTSADVSSDLSVSSEGHIFSFDVESRACLLVVPREEKTAELGKKNITLQPLYSCAQETKKDRRQESYFLLVEGSGAKDSLFSDFDSNGEATWRFFIRGQGTKNLLYDLVKNSNVFLSMRKLPADSYLRRLPEYTMTQEFPGALSAP